MKKKEGGVPPRPSTRPPRRLADWGRAPGLARGRQRRAWAPGPASARRSSTMARSARWPLAWSRHAPGGRGARRRRQGPRAGRAVAAQHAAHGAPGAPRAAPASSARAPPGVVVGVPRRGQQDAARGTCRGVGAPPARPVCAVRVCGALPPPRVPVCTRAHTRAPMAGRPRLDADAALRLRGLAWDAPRAGPSVRGGGGRVARACAPWRNDAPGGARRRGPHEPDDARVAARAPGAGRRAGRPVHAVGAAAGPAPRPAQCWRPPDPAGRTLLGGAVRRAPSSWAAPRRWRFPGRGIRAVLALRGLAHPHVAGVCAVAARRARATLDPTTRRPRWCSGAGRPRSWGARRCGGAPRTSCGRWPTATRTRWRTATRAWRVLVRLGRGGRGAEPVHCAATFQRAAAGGLRAGAATRLQGSGLAVRTPRYPARNMTACSCPAAPGG